MPAEPSADGLRRAPRVRAVLRPAAFSPAQKLLLLALNAWPLGHVVALACWVVLPPWSLAARVGAALGWLLLVPPLLARAVIGRGLPSGEVAVPSAGFFRWWTTWQLQMIFNRLPWIDEMLRLVPGLYSMWLRLWGARVGRLTLWSPGVRIYDRPLLRLGHDVVLGIDTRLSGHFGGVDAGGRNVFMLGTISLGDRTTLGGSALLGPGVALDADQTTEVLFLGTPFTQWRAGERRSAQPASHIPSNSQP